jgi:hypothetical protein
MTFSDLQRHVNYFHGKTEGTPNIDFPSRRANHNLLINLLRCLPQVTLVKFVIKNSNGKMPFEST